MAISFGSGVSLTPSTSTTPFPTNVDAHGISSSAHGTYPPYPTGVTVVAASNIASAPLNSGTGALYTILDSISIPANIIGPDGWLELWIDWSCNNSANTKTLQINFDKNATVCSDVQTTNISSTMLVRIGNRNNSAVNVVQSAPRPGGSTTSMISLTMDLTKEGHSLALWGNLAVSTDTMQVERWQLTAHNPPVYSTSRLQYGTPMFWGANAHYDDSQSIAFHIAGLKTMGMKIMRMTYEGAGSLATLVSYAQALQTDGTGIQMLCCLDAGIGGLADEATAYTSTYSTYLPVVQALAAKGVTLFECGNEMDTKLSINIGDAQGGLPSDFSNTLVPVFRGVQRGLIDAVHSVPGCIACSNAYTVCSIALSDMMWYGTNPDGTTGHNLVRWDVTNWHNYQDYGPLVGVEMGTNRPWVNIYQYLNRRYGGVPILITEWNGKSSDTDAQRAAWATRFMTEAYNNRYKYNIAATFVYEMYGSPWGILDGAANTPISTFGTTVQSFITAHPDTGT